MVSLKGLYSALLQLFFFFYFFFEDDLPKSDGKDFFQEVFESTKKAITKENVEQGRKKRQEAFEEVVSLAQCQVS